jgi:hypothetical protein
MPRKFSMGFSQRVTSRRNHCNQANSRSTQLRRLYPRSLRLKQQEATQRKVTTVILEFLRDPGSFILHRHSSGMMSKS